MHEKILNVHDIPLDYGGKETGCFLIELFISIISDISSYDLH